MWPEKRRLNLLVFQEDLPSRMVQVHLVYPEVEKKTEWNEKNIRGKKGQKEKLPESHVVLAYNF